MRVRFYVIFNEIMQFTNTVLYCMYFMSKACSFFYCTLKEPKVSKNGKSKNVILIADCNTSILFFVFLSALQSSATKSETFCILSQLTASCNI